MGSWGPVAPLEQRKVDFFLRDRGSLAELVKIQAFLGGLPPGTPKVRDLLSAPRLEARIRTAAAAFGPLPGGYGNGVLGHVAFFANRPVEVLLLSSPDLYREVGPASLRALAASYVLYEEFFGLGDLVLEPPDREPFQVVAGRILEAIGAASRRSWHATRGEEGGGELRVVQGVVADPIWSFAGRIQLDAEERPVLMELFERTEGVVFPSPWTGPSGRPVDAGPDVSHGAMTEEFLKRLLERRRKIREALGW